MLDINAKYQSNVFYADEGYDTGANYKAISSDTYVSMYKEAPKHDISLDELETICLDRLEVLRRIELQSEINSEYLKKTDLVHLIERNQLDIISGPSIVANSEKDIASHFMLRLFFCQKEELRKWYLTQETKFFKMRLTQESPSKVTKFLKSLEINYEPVEEEVWEKSAGDIVRANREPNRTPKISDYMKVPFEDVLDLVAHRNTFLFKGNAYVHQMQLLQIAVTHFRSGLSQALAKTFQYIHLLKDQDPRMGFMFQRFDKAFNGEEMAQNIKFKKQGTINLSQLDLLSEHSFPPCMKYLYTTVKKEHHLKHFSRLQLWLFLKGIGLPLEDSLKFFSSAFAKGGVTQDQFEKQYAYNIRHSYGKEGKRANYSPWSCLKVINMDKPKAKEHHGCPFENFNDAHLTQFLRGYKINPIELNKILHRKKELAHDKKVQSSQVACKMLFDTMHKGVSKDNDVGMHPNAFFNESQKFLTERHSTAGVADETMAETS